MGIGIKPRRYCKYGTSKSEREIAMGTGILLSSVQQIIQKNLGFKTFNRV